jgi:hypothetical protein
MNDAEFENTLNRAVEQRLDRLVRASGGDVRDRVVMETAKAEAMARRVTLDDAVDATHGALSRRRGGDYEEAS